MRHQITTTIEDRHQFISENADVLSDSDTGQAYRLVWKAMFNKACSFAYVDSADRNASVAYVDEVIRGDNDNSHSESYQVNMNESPQNEIERLKQHIEKRFGSISNFQLWQTFQGRHMSNFSSMKDVSTKKTQKIETTRHDTNDVYRFVVYLLTGEIPSYTDAIKWQESTTWDEAGRPNFLESAKLPRNPERGEYQIGHETHGVKCQQFSNGKLVFSGLTPQAIQRWNHYQTVIATSWWDAKNETPASTPDFNTLPTKPVEK